jgi:GNAT superfamily N-acetyltransferase
MPTTAPSDKQVAFLRRLIAERPDSTTAEAVRIALDEGQLNKCEASTAIDALLKIRPDRPARPAQRGARLPDVPAGRYATEHNGTVVFYKVDRPERGKWVGYTFLSRLASDNEIRIRDLDIRREVLGTIAADVNGAMARYGQEIGACGRCGRTLTDDASRQRGIGPDCWEILNGHTDDGEAAMLRDEQLTHA